MNPDLLKNPSRVSIIVHQNPDGDAIGSSLGLMHFLNESGHTAKVIIPDAFPSFLDFLPGSETIIDFEKDNATATEIIEKSDLLFCLDFSQVSRCGLIAPLVEKFTGPRINLDHHPEPADIYDLLYHDTRSSSTCELVYYFIREFFADAKISAATAACLYTGLVTDTGCFKYAVRPKTFHAAKKLMRTGIDTSDITSRIFDINTPEKLRMTGYSISQKLTVLPAYQTAYIMLNRAELDEFGVQKGDTEGLVNYALSVKDIKFAAFFSEKEAGKTRISFRSKGKFPANLMAKNYFGGGGHLNAAGGSFDGPPEQAVAKFLELLPQYLNEQKS